ncbi:hypothetical protein KCV03_g191, partial [Aureobasidium melanogenum]
MTLLAGSDHFCLSDDFHGVEVLHELRILRSARYQSRARDKFDQSKSAPTKNANLLEARVEYTSGGMPHDRGCFNTLRSWLKVAFIVKCFQIDFDRRNIFDGFDPGWLNSGRSFIYGKLLEYLNQVLGRARGRVSCAGESDCGWNNRMDRAMRGPLTYSEVRPVDLWLSGLAEEASSKPEEEPVLLSLRYSMGRPDLRRRGYTVLRMPTHEGQGPEEGVLSNLSSIYSGAPFGVSFASLETGKTEDVEGLRGEISEPSLTFKVQTWEEEGTRDLGMVGIPLAARLSANHLLVLRRSRFNGDPRGSGSRLRDR